MDAAEANIAKYKGAFGKEAQKKDFVKTSPLRIVDGYTADQKAVLNMPKTSHPTPVNTSKQK